MMHTIKRLTLSFLLLVCAHSLRADVVDYELIYETTLASASSAITLSAPPAGAPVRTSAQVTGISVWSNQAYTAVVARDGSAPSGGSIVLAPTKVNPQTRDSNMFAHSNSNSAGGVNLTPIYEFSAQMLVPLPFSNFHVNSDAAARVTVTITGTVGAKVKFLLYYAETRN